MATAIMTSTCTPVHFGFAHLRTPALAVNPAGPRRCCAGLLDLLGVTLGDHVACEGLWVNGCRGKRVKKRAGERVNVNESGGNDR